MDNILGKYITPWFDGKTGEITPECKQCQAQTIKRVAEEKDAEWAEELRLSINAVKLVKDNEILQQAEEIRRELEGWVVYRGDMKMEKGVAPVIAIDSDFWEAYFREHGVTTGTKD